VKLTLILFFGSIIFAYFIVKLGKHQTDAYSTAYTIETLKKNLEFYFRSELLAFAWLFFIIVGVIVFYRLNKLFEAWLLIASATFFLPFAFLEHQRYGQYGTLSYLFFALGCWSMLLDFLNRRKIFLVPQAGVIILIFIFLFSLEPTIRYFSENPRGRDQKKQVEQLRLFDSKNHQINNYCFKPEKFVENKTGVKVWDIPADWWFVGFGSAFSLFVNKNKTYQLYNDSLKCDVIFVFKGYYHEIVSE
jgi:hypothetical protein